MPWIQHFSRADIRDGLHYAPNQNTVLIQIKEATHGEFVVPKYKFSQVYQFAFDDVSSPVDPWAITDEQARDIARILRNSYSCAQNIIVHCQAGLCRSSAVAVAGKYIGFQLEDKTRIPNVLVQSKIMKALGIQIAAETSVFADWDQRLDGDI
jgi:predicted protein tyrosine phosphatase